jgi:hypothetical protein
VPGFFYLVNGRFWPKADGQTLNPNPGRRKAAYDPKQPVAGSEKSIPIEGCFRRITVIRSNISGCSLTIAFVA